MVKFLSIYLNKEIIIIVLLDDSSSLSNDSIKLC